MKKFCTLLCLKSLRHFQKKRWYTQTLTTLLFLLCFSFLQTSPTLPSKKEHKPHTLSVSAIFKNESKFLKEWIEYHLLIGVDHFYLYNCNSTDNFSSELSPYLNRGVVTLIPWRDLGDPHSDIEAYKWSFATQISAYEHALFLSRKKTKWLTFLDINEFLVTPSVGTLADFLSSHDQCAGITIECDYFDAYRTGGLPQKTFIIETVALTKPPAQNLQKKIEKVIFKPELCQGFTWPPYKCRFKNNQLPVRVGKRELRINRYLHRHEWKLFEKIKDTADVDNRFLTEDETSLLLDLDYTIEDKDRPIYRLIPELRKKMGNGPRWE